MRASTRSIARRSALTTAALLLGGGFAASSRAAEWSVVPRLQVAVEWNDNRRLVDNPEDDTFGTVARISMDAVVATERTELRLSPELSSRRYSRNKELESDDQAMRLGFAHALSARSSVDFSGSYTRTTSSQINFDETSVDDDAVDDSGDPQLTRIEAGSRRRQWVAAPTFNYRLTERLGLSASYRFSDVMYSDGLELDDPLVDFRQHSLSGTASYEVSPADTVSARLLLSRFEAPQVIDFRNAPAIEIGTRETDSVGLTLGYARRFSPTLEASVAAGVFESFFDQTVGEPPKDSDTGLLMDASLSKRFERSDLTASYARSLSPTSSGNLTERDEVRARYRYRLTPTLSARLDLRGTRSERTGSRNDDVTKNYRVQARLVKRLNRNWRVSTEYRYLQRDEDDGDDVDSNAVFVRVIYTGDKYSVSR